MKRLFSKLTYANVVATLALFLVVAGGTAFATQLAKNSVGTKQLKNNAVTSAKIKNGAVTGVKINLASLGTVPAATHADSAGSAGSAVSAAHADAATTAANAQALQGQTAAQIIASSKLTCPSGTVEVVGLCFEKAPRASANYLTAIEVCGKAAMILPSVSEMDTFDIVTKNTLPAEWAGQLYFDGTKLRAEAITSSSTSGVEIFESNPYRCAVPPAN